MQKKEERNKFNFLIFFLHSVFGIGTLMISILLFAILISSELIPSNSMLAVACLSVFLSSMLASTVSAVKFGKKLITAMLQGLFFFLLIYSIGIIMVGRLFPDVVTPWIPVACFSGSLFGAIVSAFFKNCKQ